MIDKREYFFSLDEKHDEVWGYPFAEVIGERTVGISEERRKRKKKKSIWEGEEKIFNVVSFPSVWSY